MFDSTEKPLEPLGVSIDTTARITGESIWVVKQKLRGGIYRARKSGRRTLIDFASVKTHYASLPAATYAAPRKRKAAAS